jgi:hypothetical protein
VVQIPGHWEAVSKSIWEEVRRMAGVEIFPAGLLARDKEEDVILFLQELPIPERRKKELLSQWCKYVGAALTHDMVEKVLGPLAGRI